MSTTDFVAVLLVGTFDVLVWTYNIRLLVQIFTLCPCR